MRMKMPHFGYRSFIVILRHGPPARDLLCLMDWVDKVTKGLETSISLQHTLASACSERTFKGPKPRSTMACLTLVCGLRELVFAINLWRHKARFI